MSGIHQVPSNPPSQLFMPYRADLRCSLCRMVARDHFEFLTSPIQHHSYLDLKTSAARGCPLCQLLFNEIACQSKVQNMTQSLLFEVHPTRLHILDFTSTPMYFEIFSTSPVRTLIHQLPFTPYRPIEAHADSKGTWELVNTWLSQCSSDHSACARLSHPPVFPTRVLDVVTLRIVEKSSLLPSEQLSYLTLSHCWGSKPMPVSTIARYHAYSSGIDKNHLPRTFQDAITVALKLNIRYLWIDALCIIQDSVTDWSAEADRMGSYYRQSTLNISALDAADGESGFLHRRRLQPVVSFYDKRHTRPAQPTWGEVFRKSPLSQRAWVLQERLLSTRVLHFGTNELFWECLTLSERESSSEKHAKEGQITEWGDEDFKRSLQFHSNDKQYILKKWARVVSQYSELSLSYALDIFPAMSGIAQIFSDALGYHYCAGMWIEDIHSGLLWYKMHLGRRDRTDHVWRAPSWSWASQYSPVKALFTTPSEYMNTSLTARIIEAHADVISPEHHFGKIQSAYLELEAICTDVWCKTASAAQPYNDPYLALILDIFDSGGIMIGTGYRDFLRTTTSEDLDHTRAVVISQRSQQSNISFGSDIITFFLLVTPVPDSDPRSYTRIGIGQTADSHSGAILAENAFADAPRQKIRLV